MATKKRLWLQWLKRLGWAILIVFIACYLLFRFGMDMTKSKEEILEEFAVVEGEPNYMYATMGQHTIQYVSMGNPTGPLIVFAHGSPGSWDAWLPYFKDSELLAHAQLIAYDRPGFNGSMPAEPVPSLAKQASVLAPVLDTLAKGRTVIAVGHSYGGPVAVELACRFPDQVKAILILAGSISPALEKPFFSFQSWFGKPVLRSLLPPPMDVSNREILPLKKELETQVVCWASMRASVCVLQGGDDTLVPAGNEVYASTMTPGNCGTTLMPGVDHFFIWDKTERVKQALFDLINSQ